MLFGIQTLKKKKNRFNCICVLFEHDNICFVEKDMISRKVIKNKKQELHLLYS